MIEEQNKQTSSSFMRSDGNLLDNPNQKIYKEKPDAWLDQSTKVGLQTIKIHQIQ